MIMHLNEFSHRSSKDERREDDDDTTDGTKEKLPINDEERANKECNRRSFICRKLNEIKICLKKKNKQRENEFHYLDRICRYAYPLTYFLFIVVYVIVCLNN